MKRLMHNAIDGGSSGIISHGHRNSGKSYALFHMGGRVKLIKPKSVMRKDSTRAVTAEQKEEGAEGAGEEEDAFQQSSSASRPSTRSSM